MSPDPDFAVIILSDGTIKVGCNGEDAIILTTIEGGMAERGFVPPTFTAAFLTPLELKLMIERLMHVHENLVGRKH